MNAYRVHIPVHPPHRPVLTHQVAMNVCAAQIKYSRMVNAEVR